MEFNADAHIFKSPKVKAIINEAIVFLNDTLAYELPLPEPFVGTGVYCLYYLGSLEIYNRITYENSKDCTKPIYVGKAVPKGWRTARVATNTDSTLYSRILQHSNSIKHGAGLDIKDFRCRFIILKGDESNMITIVEAEAIRRYKPLWNTVIDGFGNHDPGKGRYDQAISEWDVLHPGRPWIKRQKGQPPDLEKIKNKIKETLK